MINRYQKNKAIGFTLIEVLLGMAIILIIASGSYVGFVKFGRQQNLNISRDNLVNTLTEARSNAMSQVITTTQSPNGCKQPGTFRTLEGQRVSFDRTTDPNSYLIQEVCRDASGPYAPIVKRISLPLGTEFLSTPPLGYIEFKVRTGEAIASEIVVKIKGSTDLSQRKKICINSTGVIKSIEVTEAC
ncbi:MAG: prepilin-type N-terminal cleavage/methylation domain-containing protein [Candidatus Levybacteria bacterium]|nr:prepilin-type N-terminal cleavage/methylation domain-containing protein [Candidatus Levybacteria bacterium]